MADALPSRPRAALGRALRLILPLGALVLLSTIFLFSRSIDPDLAVQQAELDIAELTRQPRIGAARFAGVTNDDAALTIEAEAVRAISELQAQHPLELELDAPSGALVFPSTRQVTFHASDGRLDQSLNLMTMGGEVVLATSDGYHARMSVLTAALDRTEVTGSGGITATGPPGEIEADSVRVVPSPANPDGYLLAFSGNVRLIYLPDQE